MMGLLRGYLTRSQSPQSGDGAGGSEVQEARVEDLELSSPFS